MFFITYSQEIMYLSFALGALLISIAITWLLYYFISIIRDMKSVIEKAKTTISVVHDVADVTKKKISDFSIQFKALASGIGTVLDWIEKRKQDHSSQQTSEPNPQTEKKA